MLKQVTPLMLIAAVAACSSPLDRRQVNDNDAYVHTATSPELVIPAGLHKPSYNQEYKIPAIGPKADPLLVGKRLDVRPPLQVLPMAEGTHVEEGSDNIKIVVESIDNKVDLKQEIFSTLKGFMTKQGIGSRSENYEQGSIETDWIESQEVIESNMWSADKVYLLRQRYRFNVEVRPHGRTGNVTINLIEHEEHYNGVEQDILLSGEDKRRYTVDMLNSAVSYMSIKREKAIKAARLQQSLGIEVSLVEPQAGEDEQAGQAYWLAAAPYKQVWDRLRIVLPEMGFEIADMDSNKGLYFLSFNDNSGFWSSLWGDDKLPLKEGNYRILLEDGDASEQTKIVLRDAEDEPLSNEVVAGVYQALANLMKEDRNKR
ncbi:outer membrane protein assembly factor BamC [Shewanella sp. AS16]|uniref:outer membrane protein assembly factor BamC n=1 Tax=Shewanella sp. AS16 TaxID=2907625 RepID=UPI001F33D521|nr:outer membrane protein assembly factor BamC [Shewanella sp. AS16]MCE9684643.1 outer membrane protein assembly factor BamC [Shewanella sp. AS16]